MSRDEQFFNNMIQQIKEAIESMEEYLEIEKPSPDATREGNISKKGLQQ